MFRVFLRQLGRLAPSSVKALRPATCSRDPVLFFNMRACFAEIERDGSREQVVARRQLKGQQTRIYFILFICFFSHAFATTLVIPPNGDIIGTVEYAYADAGETLSEVGLRFDIGYDAMMHANPSVDPFQPLSSQTRLLIPSQFILPSGPRHGLVINLAEYRLYYFPDNDNVVITNPVGIGRKGWNTPLGITKVVAKQENPSWHPSKQLIAQADADGVLLPDQFPPGKGNPLGKHVLRLGWPTYLIHGTNQANGIGERVSAGCIRMLAQDIEYLFGFVDVGTPVRVVNEPVKIGRLNGALYIESHPVLNDKIKMDLHDIAFNQLSAQHMGYLINQAKVADAIKHPSGIPVFINADKHYRPYVTTR